MHNTNYIELMNHLENLRPFAIITTGRTGSDFLQSLMDSNTEILTFNGPLYFHDFWHDSKCNKQKSIDIFDLLDEFIGIYIHKFKSKYDYQEQKDQLGEDGTQSINIDLNLFRETVNALLKDRKTSSRSFMLAVYGSYAICLGQNLEKKSIIVHHIHHAERLPKYLLDFPSSKIICMTRDPRANFVSGILNHRKYNIKTDNCHHLYDYLHRIIVDSYSVDQYENESISLRIEDLGSECILESLCKWLEIKYENSMQYSTWAGMKWKGDRISAKKNQGNGFSHKMLENSWEKKLSFLDQYLFNFLLNDRLINYKYKNKKIYLYDYFIVFFIILLPLKFELRFFSYRYLVNAVKNNQYKILLLNIIYYIKRIVYFYRILMNKVIGFKFSREYISCDK